MIIHYKRKRGLRGVATIWPTRLSESTTLEVGEEKTPQLRSGDLWLIRLWPGDKDVTTCGRLWISPVTGEVTISLIGSSRRMPICIVSRWLIKLEDAP